MRKAQLLVSALLLVLLLLACTPAAAPQVPAPVAPAPAPTAVPASPAKPAWEVEWEKWVAAAQKEGTVIYYSTAAGITRDVTYKGFLKRFGIKAEAILGRSEQLAEKILRERMAGIYQADVCMLPPSNSLVLLKPKGALEKLEPLLILPEVTDPKYWMGGKIRWADADRTVLPALAYVAGVIHINTTLVKSGEVASYKDLLNPKWKGKIVLDDPTGLGPGGTWWVVVGARIMGYDWMREFFNTQEPMMSRDWAQQAFWLAQGKVAIGLGLQSAAVFNVKEVGAPVEAIVAKEGTYASSSNGVGSIFTKAPHPYAARVFVNWFLSKEGQETVLPGYGLPSARVDVSTEGVPIPPDRFLQPGVRYLFIDEEEFILNSPADRKKIKDLIDTSLKK